MLRAVLAGSRSVWGRPGALWCTVLGKNEWAEPCAEFVSRNKGFGLKDCKWDIFANTKSISML